MATPNACAWDTASQGSPEAGQRGAQAASCVCFCRGLPSQAFEYIRYNKGIMAEDAYPYKAKVILGRQPFCPQPGSQNVEGPVRLLCASRHSHTSPAAPPSCHPPSSISRVQAPVPGP